jgi:parallel beta helix pectate lyase-like protein
MFKGAARMRILSTGVLCIVIAVVSAHAEPNAADHPTLQAAIDANPGRMIRIPAEEYRIDAPLRITKNGTGLYGFGRVIQTNPDAAILEIEGVDDVRVHNLTLTRAAGAQEARAHGIHAVNCTGLEIVGVHVVDNHSGHATIYLQDCREARVERCRVLNYKAVTIDDRTRSPLYGYAFRVIDGTGILVSPGRGITIQNNHVIEQRLFPTEELKREHDLGQLTDGAEPMKKGELAPKGDYANNWHQGSAIVVTSPTQTDHILVTGNYIENAAQGIDLHADHVTCTQNTIRYAFIGIKCMHGSRDVIIANNNVSHNDLWGLLMQPGTASNTAQSEKPANLTTANVIANNIFSDFGHGYEYFNWKGARSGVIMLDAGPLAENPPLSRIVITGNIVHNTSGDDADAAPRYEYALLIAQNPAPSNIRVSGNHFDPGRAGVCNVPLDNTQDREP